MQTSVENYEFKTTKPELGGDQQINQTLLEPMNIHDNKNVVFVCEEERNIWL